MQVLGSSTEYPQAIVDEFLCPDPTTGCDPGLEQPDGGFEDLAISADYRHNRRNWMARASYRDFGDEFRSDLGFVPQVGFSQIVAGGEYRWYGDDGQWYNRITVGGDWDETNEQNGTLIEREIEGWVWVSGAMQSFLFAGAGHRTRVFNQVSFPQDFVNFSFELTPVADVAVFINGGYGDRIDFSYAPMPNVARQGKQLDLRPGMRYNIGRHVKINLSHNMRRLDLDEGRLFKANLTELRLVYQFNVRSFLRLITQYSAVDRDPALFESTVPDDDRSLFSQLLFTYKVNPRTALFVGYTDDRTNNGDDPFTGDPLVLDNFVQTGRAFFAKIGYAWVP